MLTAVKVTGPTVDELVYEAVELVVRGLAAEIKSGTFQIVPERDVLVAAIASLFPGELTALFGTTRLLLCDGQGEHITKRNHAWLVYRNSKAIIDVVPPRTTLPTSGPLLYDETDLPPYKRQANRDRPDPEEVTGLKRYLTKFVDALPL